jgi:hypothetical protein
MRTFLGLASRLCGCLAGLCAILALLAAPSTVRADQMSDCQACCGGLGLTGQEYQNCVYGCMSGYGECAGPSCTKCTTNCVGQPDGTLCKVNGKNEIGCSASCECTTTPPNQPNCQPFTPP